MTPLERVFFIEDDADFARELALGLRDLGYTVRIAEGLAKGSPPDRGKILAEAEEFRPDYLVLDLDLGDGNTEQGKRLLSALRQAKGLSQTYVCVLSVHVSLEENVGNREMKSIKEEVRQRGAHLVLHKEQILTGANPDAAKLVSLWPKGSGPPPIKLPRVLVLEDSKGDIDLYKKALKGRAECLFLSPVAPNRDLMETIRAFDPALIIVDLMLGGEKEQKHYPGARIIKVIREDPQLKRKRIVACSKYINPLEKDPDAPDVPRADIDRALAKTGSPDKPGFPTADDLLSPLET